LCAQFPRVEGVPYFISSIQTAGDQANIHPHIHSIVSLGIRDAQGIFHPAPESLDFSPLEGLFRHAVLAMLRKKGRLSEEFRRRIAQWDHSGFSADASTSVAQGDRKGLERVVCYSLRPPLSLSRLTYQPGASTVVYRGKFNPSSGANFQVMDAKEFLALLVSHVPEPYEVRIRYFGAASSTARQLGLRPSATDGKPRDFVRGYAKPGQPEPSQQSEFVKGRRSTWARLIARVYAADPLICPRCGGRMRIIAFVQDSAVIEKILRHLGRWDPPRGPPPPAAHQGRRIEYDEYCQDSDFAEGA
ncbi:MAG: transposase, partial [Planctomycetes bacterium]|nr:transposase [Planctomycetota bacterium]